VLTATPVSATGITASAILTINPGSSAPPPSSTLTISPQNVSVISGSTTTQQFTASSNGSTATGVSWTLTQAGSPCLASVCGSLSNSTTNPTTYTPPTTFSSAGTATLTAATTSPSQTASTTITLQAATLQSIAVTPTSPSIQVGQTLSFTPTGTYNNGQQQILASGVTWASSDTTIASINSTGVADGLKVGTTFITAASGSVSSPGTSVTLTVLAASQATFPRYLLEINGDSTISTYAVVSSTGQLRSVTYLPTSATTDQTIAASMNPNGNALYTVQPVSAGQQLVTYSVSAGGVLSQLASSPISGGNFGQVLADPLGRFLWVVDNTSIDQILSYTLDPATGTPGTQTVATSLANVRVIAADPTGTYLFSEDSSGNITAFTVASGGTLAPLGTPPTSHPFGGSNSMIVDPSGKYLYVMDASSLNQIFAYAISATGLTSISGSPFNVSNNGEVDSQMIIDPTSSFLYALDSSPTQPIDAFAIGTGGALTSITETLQAPSSAGLQQITMDPSGQYLFAAYVETHEVWTYSIAQSGTSRGTLSPVSRMRLRSTFAFISAQLLSAGGAAVTFTPQALYVTNSGSNSISEFSISASTGALDSIGGSPVGTDGSQPKGITVLPNDSFAYTADFAGKDLSPYSVANNALTAFGVAVTSGAGPVWVTSDLSGSFLYNVNQLDSNIAEFPISSGALGSNTATISTDASPVFITTEPTGQFLYTANSGGGSINAFKISLPGGTLTSVGSSVVTAPQTNWVAVDPSGRFLYATNSSANALYEFLITPSTGAITANPTSQFLPVGPSSASPGGSSVVVEPSGQYVYAANAVTNQIFAYHIDPTGGFLTEIHTSNPDSEVADTGNTPVALAVDVSGQYLYCVNSGGNDIGIYKISLSDGTLTQIGTIAVPTGGTTPLGIALTGTLQ
jgi:6-phosphogluconolactonase (cycloisomerase 2 family)